jgi:hypothetical protein
MTLKDVTLANIKNGGTTLTSGTDYSVSGNTVTLKKAYLAKQSVGTTTLIFNFSAGSNKSIGITINHTKLLEYTFDTTLPEFSFAPASSPSTAELKTTTGSPARNVLEVAVKRQNDMLILPFDLGTTKLSDYASVYIMVAAANNDGQYKNFSVEVLKTATFGAYNANTVIARNTGNALGGNGTFNAPDLPITAGDAADYTGAIDIAFGIPNSGTGAIYHIDEIRLVPKPPTP